MADTLDLGIKGGSDNIVGTSKFGYFKRFTIQAFEFEFEFEFEVGIVAYFEFKFFRFDGNEFFYARFQF